VRRGRSTDVANDAPVPTLRIAALCIALCAAACARANTSTDAQPSPTPTLPITSGDYPAYGHAPDFTWVAGRVIRSSPAGQCTFVSFSTRRGEPWGGRIALVDPSNTVARFPTDDLVVVTGTLDNRAPSTCGEPALVVRTIEEH